MKLRNLILPLALLGTVFLLAVTLCAYAGPVKVGNGDGGADLEGAQPIASGPIVEARKQALELVKRLRLEGVAGLGLLAPEIADSKLYLAQKDAQAALSDDQSPFHSNLTGNVYARTFAEPHAATRFFPAALKLDSAQLVALQVHEALHRALPESVRQDESIVSAITLAVTAPDASQDRVAKVVARLVPESDVLRTAASAPGPAPAVEGASAADPTPPIPEDALVRKPSLVAYTFRDFQFKHALGLSGTGPVKSMQTIQSFLYPFGNTDLPLGIGLEAAFINTAGATESGPLSVSARLRLWSHRGYDIGAWGVTSFNTLSAEELKSSPLGRDVTTLGLSIRKDLALAYVENFLSVTLPSEAHDKIGLRSYTHSFGKIINASVHAGASVWKLRVGGYAEIFLSDYHRITGGETDIDTGRTRIFAGGPEATLGIGNFFFKVDGRFILSSSHGEGFEELGNIMGQGTGQGSVSATAGLYF